VNRYERLVNLVVALYATEQPLTRSQIFERIPDGYEGNDESTRRAFERDKEALRGLGIPLVTAELGDELGYRIDRGEYELPAVEFETDELAALHLALATVRLEGAADPESALWKLGGALAPEDPAPGERVALSVSDRLAELYKAATERRVVTFTYKGERREVEPRGVAYRSGHWYLAAFDRDRQALRNFRLDRFDGEPEAGPAGAFERPDGPPPRAARPWEMGEGEPLTAQLLVDADLAGWVEQDLGSAAVSERRDDGSVVFALPVTNPAGFRSFALGLLDRAEVLGPPELRDDMVSWLEAAAR
jgi:predicted DNA-binding transcriptional regulator YafY